MLIVLVVLGVYLARRHKNNNESVARRDIEFSLTDPSTSSSSSVHPLLLPKQGSIQDWSSDLYAITMPPTRNPSFPPPDGSHVYEAVDTNNHNSITSQTSSSRPWRPDVYHVSSVHGLNNLNTADNDDDDDHTTPQSRDETTTKRLYHHPRLTSMQHPSRSIISLPPREHAQPSSIDYETELDDIDS